MDREWGIWGRPSENPTLSWTLGVQEAGSITISLMTPGGDVETPFRIEQEGSGWRLTSVADEAEAAELHGLGIFGCEDRAMGRFASWHSKRGSSANGDRP